MGDAQDPLSEPALCLVCQQALLVQVYPLALFARVCTALLGLAKFSIVATQHGS